MTAENEASTDHLVAVAEPGFDHRPTMTAEDGKRLMDSGPVFCSTCGRTLILTDLRAARPRWTHLPKEPQRRSVMDDETRVAAIRERASQATPGPWFHYYGDVVLTGHNPRAEWTPEQGNDSVFRASERRAQHGELAIRDAMFAAAAREDIPWLLDRLRAAEAERDDLRDKLTRPLPPDSHDAEWWRRTSSFWAGQDEMHERELRAAEARAAEAEAIVVALMEATSVLGSTDAEMIQYIGTAFESTRSEVVFARVKAEAWDEGFTACASGASLRNPHRAGADQ